MRATSSCIALLIIATTLSCSNAEALKRSADAGFSDSSSLRYELVRTLPHARDAFTEGLEICDGEMLESVGLYGVSALIRKRIDDGEVLQRHDLPAPVFAEGTTCLKGLIYQLTYREQIVVVYDNALAVQKVMRYDGEGWGLTHDDTQLIMSNGSATLSFRSPQDFRVTRTLEVRDRGSPVPRLNELEYVHGLIFANVWQTDRIAVIDAADGAVRAWLDLRDLSSHFDKPADWNPVDDVLNGIAYDAVRGSFYVTGKRWPLMFELRIPQLPKPR